MQCNNFAYLPKLSSHLHIHSDRGGLNTVATGATVSNGFIFFKQILHAYLSFYDKYEL